MKLRKFLPEVGLAVIALLLGSWIADGALSCLLLSLALGLALFTVFEDLRTVLSLGVASAAVVGLFGVAAEQFSLIFLGVFAGLPLLAAIALVLAALADDLRRLTGRRLARRLRSQTNAKPDRAVRPYRKAVRATEEEPGSQRFSISQALVGMAVRRLPDEMSDGQRERWEEEMRADVASVSWSVPRVLYAFGLWRKGAPEMPSGKDERATIDRGR